MGFKNQNSAILRWGSIILLSGVCTSFTVESVAQNTGATSLEHTFTYSFEKGFYNTYIEAMGDTVALICPNLNQLYVINTDTKQMDTIKFSRGRGPGEISRGPFGIDFSGHSIFMGDTDAQRFSVYDLQTKSLTTGDYYAGLPMTSIYHMDGKTMLVDPNVSREVAYFIYDPSDKKVIKLFKFPDQSSEPYRYSGLPGITENYLVHANRYYADLLVWDRQSEDFIRSSVIKSVKRPEAQEARMGNLTGMIPPRDPELKIIALAGHPTLTEHVFMLMESKDGEYNRTYVYEYDFMEDEIVGSYKLKSTSMLLASSGKHLFVYSEEKDELYQYDILSD